MDCLTCGAVNEAGRKFCGDCGARLAVTCPACGSANPPGVRFCGECGARLATAGSDATAPAATLAGTPVGASVPASASAGPGAAAPELKVVSVLFIDLVGFTGASERRDPEAVRETLSRYFEVATTVIERYGGTIEKFIGDAVMAVFGTPIAHEDDAERAVRAAIDLVAAVEAMEADGARLAARAAVLTGEAAVTPGARNQGLVAGDLVNTASRLQALAAAGTVLVGESTARAASGAIVFEPAGEHLVKGRERPIVAFHALRVVGKRGGVGRSESLEAPFVGRDAELRLVRELYHATARERRARLVSIVGQAGIGKSRLLWEFSKYTDGLAETLLWHQGRSPAYGEGVTFWALGEMIRQRAAIIEGADAEATRAKLAAIVAEYLPDEADRRSVEPALRQVLGVHDGRPIERDELFATLRTFFERLAERHPTALVFEDLHWADSGLLDFIEYLLEWSRPFPIYIVTLARPELLERRPTWGAGQRSFTSISLEPLPDAAMRQLLAGLVPGLPEGVVRAILARAEGVPLYAVETVRMLLQEGRLEPADGAYRPVGDLTSIAIPETLQALIAARLDGLDPADRSLLQDAAVLGLTFAPAALAAVCGEAEASLEPRLRTLVRREILALDSDPRSPERGQYGFVQALIREVAYASLAKRERRARHLAAARYFEAQDDDELAGVLARHYLDAYRASPAGPEADALAAQARVALRAAADRAVALGSHVQALAYLQQAATVTHDAAELAELQQRIGGSARSAGQYAVAEAAFRRAAEEYRALADRPARARALAALGRLLTETGADETARSLLQDALEEFADLPDDPSVVHLQMRYVSAIRGSQADEALRILEDALTRAERLGLVELVVEGLMGRTATLVIRGRTLEAAALVRGAQALARAHGLVDSDLRASNLLAFMAATDDPRAGFAPAIAGIELARRLGRRDSYFAILGNALRHAFRLGDWDWLVATVDEALALAPEGFNDSELRDGLLIVQALRGTEVAAEVGRVGRLVDALEDPQSRAWHGIAAAWAELAAGRPEAAFERAVEAAAATPFYAREALPLACRAALRQADPARFALARGQLEAAGAPGLAVDADRATVAAGAAALAGERDAPRLYREAIERWRALGLAWDLALCQADFALVCPAEADAAEAAAEAGATFRRLGAMTMLAGMAAAGPAAAAPRAGPPARPHVVLDNRGAARLES